MNMTAVDTDDIQQGGNAKIRYSIEKNAIDDASGNSIFEINPSTGEIRTAICCLDRERTAYYSIQVVASDGGGLKGTGDVMILVKDVNDSPPEFTNNEWFTELDETEGENVTDEPILTVTVLDQDDGNKFQYEILRGSGYGANKFIITANSDGTGTIRAVEPLDYEDIHGNTLRFKIQVTDKNEDNITSEYHTSYSWVTIKLKDINDNKPVFDVPYTEVSVAEDAEVGLSVHSFTARDPDNNGKSKVFYFVDHSLDPMRHFDVDHNGTVIIQRPLDREKTPVHEVHVLAVDDGIPAKTSTATLYVVVQDVNDNFPHLLEEYKSVLPENMPPREIMKIRAADDDDYMKQNGPPFFFRMDPAADEHIHASFTVVYERNDADGEGSASVSSLVTFDREQEKEYRIPVLISDSGQPALTGTGTVIVVIGDVNDNKMKPGMKNILVYSYQGQTPDTDIGRIYVEDPDDWDLPDKTFFWEGGVHPGFKINERTGMIRIQHSTPEGVYNLKFKVYDKKHLQTSPAYVTVTVKKISHDNIINSGSIRIADLSDEEFIKWNFTGTKRKKSKAELLVAKLAKLFSVSDENVNIFSISLHKEYPPILNVFFSIHDTQYYKPVEINGIVQINKEQVSKEVGINIIMVGIDDCLQEKSVCQGPCSSAMEIGKHSLLVDANMTSFVSVSVTMKPECTCKTQKHRMQNQIRCYKDYCYNGGHCLQKGNGISCLCPSGFDGPRCQQTTSDFNGRGWAWFSPLQSCNENHLSIEFVTRKRSGILLYNGPLSLPQPKDIFASDYILLEIIHGQPQFTLDLGSGVVELRLRMTNNVTDGQWHHIDLFWNTKNARLVVDYCQSAIVAEAEDGTTFFNGTACQTEGKLPPFSEHLNLNTPLQIGGIYKNKVPSNHYKWQGRDNPEGFDGCIRNIFHNGELLDLSGSRMSSGTGAGCVKTEDICRNLDCGNRGSCVADLTGSLPICLCQPGWSGITCLKPTHPFTFLPHSYVKFALSFEPNHFSTLVQMRFRTKETSGELIHIADHHSQEYAILEIQNSILVFRYNLNSYYSEEIAICLCFVPVNDGYWHTVKASRYGSTAFLQIDDGENAQYNGTFSFRGHQLLVADKREGIYAGGKAEYTGMKTFEIQADFKNGCMDDIRLYGKSLPLPPVINATQWAQAVVAHNVVYGCTLNDSCAFVNCPEPLRCVEMSDSYECVCAEEVLKFGNSDCTDNNGCSQLPCWNGGMCISQDILLQYNCSCPDGTLGPNCESVLENQTFRLSPSALAAIIACFICIFALAVGFLVWSHRTKNLAESKPENYDTHKNGESCCDKLDSVENTTALDIKSLHGTIERKDKTTCIELQHVHLESIIIGRASAIEKCKKEADIDLIAHTAEDCKVYAYEGDTSAVPSISSPASVSCVESQTTGVCANWGPQFATRIESEGHTDV